MDKDRIEGAAREVVGTIKENVGKLSGDHKLQVEGVAEHAAGVIQSAIGTAKDQIHAAVKPKT